MVLRATKVNRKIGYWLHILYQSAWVSLAKCSLGVFLMLPVAGWAGGGSSVHPSLLVQLKAGPRGAVTDVLGPVTLRLAGVERSVRLAGLWPGISGVGQVAADTALADRAAIQALEELIRGRVAQLYLDQQVQDRFGHWLAQVWVVAEAGKPGVWLQGWMLEHGHARTYTTVGSEALVAEMLALEGQARRAASGLWARPEFAVRSAFSLDQAANSFQIVEGIVAKVAVTGSRVYLNFGEDWRRDFTVVISRPDATRFPAGLRGLKALAGRQVRVRGWVFGLNGPAIRADHAGVLEEIKE